MALLTSLPHWEWGVEIGGKETSTAAWVNCHLYMYRVLTRVVIELADQEKAELRNAARYSLTTLGKCL